MHYTAILSVMKLYLKGRPDWNLPLPSLLLDATHFGTAFFFRLRCARDNHPAGVFLQVECQTEIAGDSWSSRIRLQLSNPSLQYAPPLCRFFSLSV